MLKTAIPTLKRLYWNSRNDMINVLHLIGPGGAGKTSAGMLLAKQLGWQFVDLDERFIDLVANIRSFIEMEGYRAYAQQNLALYKTLLSKISSPTVLTLSSGFMTYPTDIAEDFSELLRQIEMHPLSALLLPSFELEECVEMIVSRQLSRPYLNGTAIQEAEKIRRRFPAFISLRCARFLSNVPPSEVARRIAELVHRIEESHHPRAVDETIVRFSTIDGA